VLLALAAACGGGGPTPRRDSPEPARAPAVATAPAGQAVLLAVDQPEGVVVTPGSERIVIAARRPASLVLLDPRHLGARPVLFPSPGAARHLSLRGSQLLVAGEDTDNLSVVDPLTGVVLTRSSVGDHPHDAVAIGSAVVVAEEDADSVAILDQGRVVARISGSRHPGGIAASAGRAAAVEVRGRRLDVIDVAGRRLVARVPIGAGPTHAVEVGDGIVAVADTSGDEVLLVSLRGDPHVIARTHLYGRPYCLASDPDRHLLWVATGADNTLRRLAVTGSGTGTRLVSGATLPTVQQPNSLAVVPSTGQVVVVGATNPGWVQLVSGG
jgi:DNA-binding beta-propeller fold protein YncE